MKKIVVLTFLSIIGFSAYSQMTSDEFWEAVKVEGESKLVVSSATPSKTLISENYEDCTIEAHETFGYVYFSSETEEKSVTFSYSNVAFISFSRIAPNTAGVLLIQLK